MVSVVVYKVYFKSVPHTHTHTLSCSHKSAQQHHVCQPTGWKSPSSVLKLCSVFFCFSNSLHKPFIATSISYLNLSKKKCTCSDLCLHILTLGLQVNSRENSRNCGGLKNTKCVMQRSSCRHTSIVSQLNLSQKESAEGEKYPVYIYIYTHTRQSRLKTNHNGVRMMMLT